MNNPGAYRSVCVELDVRTDIQSVRVHNIARCILLLHYFKINKRIVVHSFTHAQASIYFAIRPLMCNHTNIHTHVLITVHTYTRTYSLTQICTYVQLSALAVCAIMSSSLLDSEEGFEANKKGRERGSA